MSRKKSEPEQGERVEIEFRDGEGRSENLKASPVGRSLYRLEASPAFAYSVSRGDVVRARRSRDGMLRFSASVEKSGNRTVRVIFARFSADSDAAKPILEEIERLGCSYESSQPTMLCLNVPQDVSLSEVVEYMKTLGMWWEHADPTREELYPA